MDLLNFFVHQVGETVRPGTGTVLPARSRLSRSASVGSVEVPRYEGKGGQRDGLERAGRSRYGHEWLYAETPGGTALGYLDVKTGGYHSDDLSNLPLLEKAIGDHLAAQRVACRSRLLGTPSPMPHPEGELVAAVVEEQPTAEVPEPAEWVDISGTRAGSAAREQAIAARAAQGKFKGFLARASM